MAVGDSANYQEPTVPGRSALWHHPHGMMCTSLAAEHVYTMTDRYDVIVVGSGAGGGTLAHTLAPSPGWQIRRYGPSRLRSLDLRI